jgi:toxin ParE1/3/4
MKVTWTPAAVTDRRRIGAYLTAQNPVLSARVLEGLILSADSLVVFPDRGGRGKAPGTRELVVEAPYIITYEVLEDAVRILRIRHAAQERG